MKEIERAVDYQDMLLGTVKVLEYVLSFPSFCFLFLNSLCYACSKDALEMLSKICFFPSIVPLVFAGWFIIPFDISICG
jgi:hypothetical protein